MAEEPRLWLLEDRVPRKIFGPKWDVVTGEWRRLHSEELNDLYSPPNIRVIKSRRIKWTEHVARMGERRVVYRVLMGKPEREREREKEREGATWKAQAYIGG